MLPVSPPRTMGPQAATNIPFPSTPTSVPNTQVPEPTPTPGLADTLMSQARGGTEAVGGVEFVLELEITATVNGVDEVTDVAYIVRFNPSADYTHATMEITGPTGELMGESVEFFEGVMVRTDGADAWSVHERHETPYHIEARAFFGQPLPDGRKIISPTQPAQGLEDTHLMEASMPSFRIVGVNAIMTAKYWVGRDDGLLRQLTAEGQASVRDLNGIIDTRPDSGDVTLNMRASDFKYGSVDVETPTILNRYDHQSVLLRDGRALVAGGSIRVMEFWSTLFPPLPQTFDPDSGWWTTRTGLLSEETIRLGTPMVQLPDGRVLFVGLSALGDGQLGSAASVFDPVAETFTHMVGPSVTRADPGLAVLSDGRVLAAGGSMYPNMMSFPTLSGAAEILDLGTMEWIPAAGMNLIAGTPALFTLEDGAVLALGRRDSADNTELVVELYDPVQDTWTLMDGPATGHRLVGAIQLMDGRVLVLGEEPLTSAVYIPDTGTWTSTGEVATTRRNAALTLLSDGSVLLSGGEDASRGDYVLLDSTELFDPGSLAWEPGPSLNIPRTQHTGTQLADGSVLMAGGVGQSEGEDDSRLALPDELLTPPPR